MNLDEHQCNLVFRDQDPFGQHRESALKDEPALITAVFFPRMFKSCPKFRRTREIKAHACSGVTYSILLLSYGFLYFLFRSLSTLLLRSSNIGSQLAMNSVLRTQRADRLYDLLTKRVSESSESYTLSYSSLAPTKKKQTNNH